MIELNGTEFDQVVIGTWDIMACAIIIMGFTPIIMGFTAVAAAPPPRAFCCSCSSIDSHQSAQISKTQMSFCRQHPSHLQCGQKPNTSKSMDHIER